MSLNGNVVERAAKIIKTNRYLTIATYDREGVWCSPLNYVVGPGEHLVFYSAHDARHSKAIGKSGKVSGAIFNSAAPSSEVDGLQFAGTCQVLKRESLEAAHEHYFRVNFANEEERQYWYRDVAKFSEGAKHRFYGIELREIYVIDFDSIEAERLDQRVRVHIDDVWKQLNT